MIFGGMLLCVRWKYQWEFTFWGPLNPKKRFWVQVWVPLHPKKWFSGHINWNFHFEALWTQNSGFWSERFLYYVFSRLLGNICAWISLVILIRYNYIKYKVHLKKCSVNWECSVSQQYYFIMKTLFLYCLLLRNKLVFVYYWFFNGDDWPFQSLFRRKLSRGASPFRENWRVGVMGNEKAVASNRGISLCVVVKNYFVII